MKHRRYKYKLYSQWIGYKCANPGCSSGRDIEIHHILPLGKGGEDDYWNLISLCHNCHVKNRLHSRHDEHDIELFTWKCIQELETFGFVLDEQDDRYYDNLKRLLSLNVEDHKAEDPKL